MNQSIHPEGGEFKIISAFPGSFPDDELGLVEAVHGLGEGVVVRVADRADRRVEPDLDEALGVPDRVVLRPGVTVMDQIPGSPRPVDTIPPAIVIDGGSAASIKSATPTISGRVNVPAGSKIQVAVDNVALDVVVSPTRTWTVTSPQLTAGAHTVVVSATDAACNVGTQPQSLTVNG